MTRTHGLVLAIYFAMGSMAHATEMPVSTGEAASPAPDAIRVSGADLKAFGWTQSETNPSPVAALPDASPDAAGESKPSPTEGIAEMPAPDPTDGRSASLTAPQPGSEPSAPNIAESNLTPTASESQVSAPLSKQNIAAAPAESPAPTELGQSPNATSTTPNTESAVTAKAEAPASTPVASPAPAIDVTPSLVGATTATPNATTPLPPNSTVTENSGP